MRKNEKNKEGEKINKRRRLESAVTLCALVVFVFFFGDVLFLYSLGVSQDTHTRGVTLTHASVGCASVSGLTRLIFTYPSEYRLSGEKVKLLVQATPTDPRTMPASRMKKSTSSLRPTTEDVKGKH